MHMRRLLHSHGPATIRAATVGVVLGGLVFSGGCQPGGPAALWPLSPKPAASAPQPDLEENPFLVRLAPSTPTVSAGVAQRAVQFRVMKVEAPLGSFSRSQKIWDHLDEQAVGIETQMVLQRNGLRVGLGSPESWPPVQAILQTVEKRNVRPLPPSLPNSLSVSLELHAEPADETIFFYRSDGQMAGEDYPGATDVLRITWEFYSDNIENVAVYITPEVRQEHSGETFKVTPMGVAVVPIYTGRVFRELACRLVVPPGGYVVLGPSAQVDRVGLLGRQFLVSEIDGEPYETLLVIVPEVVDLSPPAAGQESQAAVPAK